MVTSDEGNYNFSLFSVIDVIKTRQDRRLFKRLTWKDAGAQEDDDVVDAIYDRDNAMSACCCRRVYPDYEDSVEGWYNVWKVLNTRLQVWMAGKEENLLILKSEQKSLDAKIKRNGKLIEETTDETMKAVLKGEIKAWEATKDKIDLRKKSLNQSIKAKQAEIEEMRSQGDGLEASVDAVIEEKVFKKTNLIQRVINYMLYLIFIINAFIAGFGMAAVPTT